MKKYILDKLNIQIFAEAGEPSGGGGEPAPGGETTGGEGTSQAVEVPEYINSYVEGIEDAGQKEYLQGLLKDEKGVNTLKNFIQDPNREWDIKAEDYDIGNVDVAEYLKGAKERGMSEEMAKSFLSGRVEYLKTQREAMSPELRALDEPIQNFIGAEKDPEIQQVYARLAENAKGREVLQRLMTAETPATPGITGGNTGAGTGYTHDSFIIAFNDAYDKKDNAKLQQLKTFANNSKDSFYKDFLGD